MPGLSLPAHHGRPVVPGPRPLREKRGSDPVRHRLGTLRHGGLSHCSVRQWWNLDASKTYRLCQLFKVARQMPHLKAGRSSHLLGSTFARTHSTISVVVAPGVNTVATPIRFSSGRSSSGMIPPPKTTMSVGVALLQQVDDLGEQRHVRAGEHREADRVGVLLDGGLDDLLRRLVQAGVDDLHAGVPQGAGHDLGAAVVTVQARLGHHHPDGRARRSERCSRGSAGSGAVGHGAKRSEGPWWELVSPNHAASFVADRRWAALPRPG